MSYDRERSDLEALERGEDTEKKTSHDLTTRQSSTTTTEMNSIDVSIIRNFKSPTINKKFVYV